MRTATTCSSVTNRRVFVEGVGPTFWLLVDGHGADKQILLCRRREELGRRFDVRRHVARVVDDRVEGPPLQGFEISALTVALQVFEFWKQLAVGLAAMEERDRVASRQRTLHEMRPEEPGASEHEQAQGLGRWNGALPINSGSEGVSGEWCRRSSGDPREKGTASRISHAKCLYAPSTIDVGVFWIHVSLEVVCQSASDCDRPMARSLLAKAWT